MDKRVGVVGVIVDDRESTAPKVNAVLSQYGDIVVGRMGLPYKERGVSVIALIVDGTADQIGALSGKLGSIEGVKVKAAVTSGK